MLFNMHGIDKPPVIASASNFFSFDSCSNSSVTFNPNPSNVSSSNTYNHHGTPDAQACSQPPDVICATPHAVPLPVLDTPTASSIVPPPPVKAHTDENDKRAIAPLTLRGTVATSSIGLKLQQDQNQDGAAIPPPCNVDSSSIVPSEVSQPQANDNMPPTSTRVRGKKRKSIPAGETATPTKPKKPRKPRALSAKQKGKQKEAEVSNDNQVPQVDSESNSRDDVTKHILPDQFTVHYPRRALENTTYHNGPHTIRHPSTWIVQDAQHLRNLFSNYSLPEIFQVDITKQHPTRILDLMLSVFDESQRILSAYFVPYIWFPKDPNRPYRLQPDDKYFWGERISEYHHRVQCGRIAYTVTRRPILFFKREEKEMIDLINYNIILNAHRRITQAKSLPGIAVGRGLGATNPDVTSSVTSSSQVHVLPTQEQPPSPSNVWNFDYNSTLTEATMAQPHPLPSTSLVNVSADLPPNKETNVNSDFNYNIPSMIQPGPTSQSFPPSSDSAFDQSRLEFSAPENGNNDAPDINADASPDFIFNINDLPVIEETYSDATSLGQTSDEFDIDRFVKSFDCDHSANDTAATAAIGSTADPEPSNIAQSISELEEMYMDFDWFESSQKTQSSTSN